MTSTKLIRETFEKGEGIFRLAPVFVPRRFSKAGHRLKLHPDDYYVLGTKRGSIKERWFSSIIPAMNGELAPPDEGMSYVSPNEKIEDKFLFKDAVDELGAEIIGNGLKSKYGTWPMYSKFFDYEAALFHHVHLMFEHAAKVGRLGKPEAYYYPPQLNNYGGEFPHTYFGFDPDVTKNQVKERLLIELGSTRIKTVLIGADNKPVASGSHDWENSYVNNIWTYSLEDIWKGVQDSYRKMAGSVKEQFGVTLKITGAIGFSGMMRRRVAG
jgi:hypothetical protein